VIVRGANRTGQIDSTAFLTLMVYHNILHFDIMPAWHGSSMHGGGHKARSDSSDEQTRLLADGLVVVLLLR
jgi:hypothetical protein